MQPGGGSSRSNLSPVTRTAVISLDSHTHKWLSPGSRPRAPLVGAGLQRDIGSRAAYIQPRPRRIAQRHHLGMRAARLLGEALHQHPTIRRRDHAADARVGAGKKKRLGGEPKRLVDRVGRGNGHCAGDGSAVAICSSSWDRSQLHFVFCRWHHARQCW